MTDFPSQAVYFGHVMHMRLSPRTHNFRYRAFSLLVDIDQLGESDGPRLLRHNRFGLMSVMDRDHGPRDGSPLRPWVDAQLARKGLPHCDRVMMLCFPRMLGYVFNPLTIYFGYDEAGRLSALIYEVKNTFGDQVAYVHPAGASLGGSHRQTQDKAMFVSPFIAMDQTYNFTIRPPGDRVSVRIRQSGPGGDALIATQTGRARPLSDAVLARAFLSYPLMTIGVIARIHWQALRLALKGLKFRRYSRSRQASTDAEVRHS